MNDYNHNKNTLENLQKKLIEKPIYKKMLNNLLGITGRDNSIFVSSKINNLDLFNLVLNDDRNKILKNKEFNVTITEGGNETLINSLIATSGLEEFIEIANKTETRISIADQKLLDTSFLEAKFQIIEKLKTQKNYKISKWKRFKNKYLDKQAQLNIWPLYVGFLFLKVKTIKAPLYAPLLLKKVEIDISSNNIVRLKSIDDTVEINEKLLFMLENEYKINVPQIQDKNGITIFDATQKIKPFFNEIISNDVALMQKFEFLTKNQVSNQDLQYAPGLILTIITSPSGGTLRNKLIDMLMKEDLDELLSFNTLKNMKQDIETSLQRKQGIFRIHSTDLSQEKAIFGSLKDHALIWGPPGTGKSQTIANLLANLLFNENSVLVTSEKKAALDVIKKRMGKLAKYMFFGLTDNNINKQLFYKPFQELLSQIFKVNENSNSKFSFITPNSFILDLEWSYFNQKKKLTNVDVAILSNLYKNIKSDVKLKPKLKILNTLMFNNKTFFENQINNIENTVKQKGYLTKVQIFEDYFPETKKLNGKEILDCVFLDIKKNNLYSNSLIKIQDISNLENFDQYLTVENNINKMNKKFETDIDFLNSFLAQKFKQKLYHLRQNINFKKNVDSFIKACNSGWRKPCHFVNKYKDVINSLFNVYISTPHKLADTINVNCKYDFVIFDEASQLHLEKAIPFVSLGKKIIIAGDNQQMKPTNYFGIRDKTQFLEEMEENVPSLLEYAHRRGLKPQREYMLTKNYRSKCAELMSFSSKEFYDGKLNVVDDVAMRESKAIEVFDVYGEWKERVNQKEAFAILQKLLELSHSYNKIILLTLNSTQKQYIENLIYSEKKFWSIVAMIAESKVVLRNLENIQGDEADLVLISVAYDKTAKWGSTYVARPEGKYSLNVAISRAIWKIIIFKSISSDEIISNNTNDSIRVFKDWLFFLECPKQKRTELLLNHDTRNECFDSTFEEEVYNELNNSLRLNAKIDIKTQHAIGSYRLDLAIFLNDRDFILGIEVDGYKYYSGYEKMIQDIERQSFIEAKGYSPIYRVLELSWTINKEKVIKEIKSLIHQRILHFEHCE